MGESNQLLYSVGEVASILSIGRTKTYYLIRDGKLRSVKLGGRRLIPKDALDEFVADLADVA